MHTPLPKSLQDECHKVASIIREFCSLAADKKLTDRIIPEGILRDCKGIAVLSVVKAGIFFMGARGGSGLAIAKRANGTWTAPAAIGMSGINGGFEFGLEVTDFVFILNTVQAVDSFATSNFSFGANLTVAVGPVGRNIEGDVRAIKPAAVYAYSKSKGLFGGITLEACGFFERKDANAKMYGHEVRGEALLRGDEPSPKEATVLYRALFEACMGSTKGDGPILQGYEHRSSYDDTLHLGEKGGHEAAARGEKPKSRSKAERCAPPPPRAKATPIKSTDTSGARASVGYRPPVKTSHRRHSSWDAVQSKLPYTDPTKIDWSQVDASVNPWAPVTTTETKTATPTTTKTSQSSQSASKHSLNAPPARPPAPKSSSKPSRPPAPFSTTTATTTTNTLASPPPIKPRPSSTNTTTAPPPIKPRPISTNTAPTTTSTTTDNPAGSPTPAPRPRPRPRPRSHHGDTIQQVIAFASFEPDAEGDMALVEGDIVTVTQSTPSLDDWWQGTNQRTGESGTFPRNYCKECIQ